eukprot:2518459-Prymnesium_polylepis.1
MRGPRASRDSPPLHRETSVTGNLVEPGDHVALVDGGTSGPVDVWTSLHGVAVVIEQIVSRPVCLWHGDSQHLAAQRVAFILASPGAGVASACLIGEEHAGRKAGGLVWHSAWMAQGGVHVAPELRAEVIGIRAVAMWRRTLVVRCAHFGTVGSGIAGASRHRSLDCVEAAARVGVHRGDG